MPHVLGSASVVAGMDFFSFPIWAVWTLVGIYFVSAIVMVWQLHD